MICAEKIEMKRNSLANSSALVFSSRRIILALLITLFAVGSLSASDYANRRQVAMSECQKIDPTQYQTGLLFNPDGYRSFYVRSECLQKVAVQFRDPELCSQVRRHWSLYSSWGISQSQCRKLVAEHVASDRKELEQLKPLYSAGAMRLQSLRLERNGNGRDFDFLPAFSGSYSHGYTITIEILPLNHAPVLIHRDGYYIDSASNLRIYVRQADIRARFPELQLSHSYQLRATVTLSVPQGGINSYWSDAFIESIFPARDRSQSLTIDTSF